MLVSNNFTDSLKLSRETFYTRSIEHVLNPSLSMSQKYSNRETTKKNGQLCGE